jgi:hypothetical protein
LFWGFRQSNQLQEFGEADPLIADVELRVYALQEDVAENPESYH